jgi:glucose/arabinose dehydrogenase
MNTLLLRFALPLLSALPLAVTPASAATIALKQAAEGFTSPLVLLSHPDGSGDLVVVDQVGVASVVKKDGAVGPTPFLDLRSRLTTLRTNFDERGFLGLAFHPEFKRNGKLYVYYSAPLRAGAPKGWDHTSHIAEFKVKAGDAKQADPATERVLLQIDEPQFNHNGGRIAFGSDGFLYIGMGDGGAGNDKAEGHAPEGNGQNKDTLLGKILRLDVNRTEGDRAYGIPRDNPFAKGGGRPEIYAWGIRNPWGISFDRGGKRELFVADVGQSMWEEINIIVKGGNYGWRLREGDIGFDADNPLRPPEAAPTEAADGSALIAPIVAYKNAKGHPGTPDLKGTSVTGGYVYRGKALPDLAGHYVFADWSRNWGVADGGLFAAAPPKQGGKEWTLAALPPANFPSGLKGYIVAMGEDDQGELYVLTNGTNMLKGRTGKVYKIVPAGFESAAK